jgi:trimeric autotransporter adhesin
VDAAGNLYIADKANQRIRVESAPVGGGGPGAAVGIISTFAGNGAAAFSGDGGAAASAELHDPYGVVVDGAGHLYISDQLNQRIRMTSNGSKIVTIATIAGNGTAGFSGDGYSAIAGELNGPSAMAVDASGNLFIADTANGRVREVLAGAATMVTVAGNGMGSYPGDNQGAQHAELVNPAGIAVDAAGNIYIAEESGARVRMVNPAGVITTVAGNGVPGFPGDGGPATSASLSQPTDVAVDAAGNLYIADPNNQRIRMVSATTGDITTIAGDGTYGYGGDGDPGPATKAEFRNPEGIAFDAAGNLYIADSGNCRIRKMTPTGAITTVAGNGQQGFYGDGGAATAAKLLIPAAVRLDGMGNLYISDTNNQRIRKVTPSGTISTVAGNGTTGFFADGGPAILAALNRPIGMAVDAAGNLYIADSSNYRVRRVSPAGAITTVAGNGTFGFAGDGGDAMAAELGYVSAVVVDGAGNLYISDTINGRVRKVTY